jgi:hypothetical protein
VPVVTLKVAANDAEGDGADEDDATVATVLFATRADLDSFDAWVASGQCRVSDASDATHFTCMVLFFRTAIQLAIG